MKQKPLLISLLISLGTGVIAGFLTFKSMEQYQNEPPNNCENQNSVMQNSADFNTVDSENQNSVIRTPEMRTKSWTN